MTGQIRGLPFRFIDLDVMPPFHAINVLPTYLSPIIYTVFSAPIL